MVNNPFYAMMAQLIQSGGDPNRVLQQMAQKNPQVGQVLDMMRGKSAQELHQVAQNIAQQRGLDLNAIYQSLGIRF